MKLRWAALSLVLALSALMPRSAQAQSVGAQPPQQRRVTLGQNYPNPFNPETRWRFSIDPDCTDPSRQYRVTLRVYNLLAQVVAIPVLLGGNATSSGGGTPALQELTLTCGTYTAYWDGKYLNTGREAASGVYLSRLDVDGRVEEIKRILVAK
jgi:hypothetical protein